jgi:predicted amidohydrolase YtcJ
MQPIHMDGDIAPASLLWAERCKYAYAMRSISRSGSPLLFGSDAPVADPDPLKGICVAVTRKGPDGKPERGWYPDERISVEEAVRSYTWNPAALFGEEANLGSIEIGKIADIVILADDIFSMQKEKIRKTRVTGTIMEGEFVYRP